MLANIFTWLNDTLLKMTWLSDLVDTILTKIFSMDADSVFFSSLSFFLFDVIKIFILLCVIIYISSYLQTYITVERTRTILSKFKGIGANIVGALLGTVTPFCSCSSIPIFIGFTRAGLPIGVTFSFLISSPLVDLASVVLLASIFGWKVAIMYVIVGLILAVVGGTLISVFKMEKYVEDFVKNGELVENLENTKLSRKEKHKYAFDQVTDIMKRVWKYILIGVAIGAIIHGYIPTEFINKILGADRWYSVFVAVFAGIPMYADIFGTLPIAEALVLKGVGLGTVLAFMMAVTTLSIPSIILLKKVIKNKLLIMFIAIVSFGIIIIGYIFNYLIII
ncbi:permease [Mycoplasmatota bacterium WC30]